MNKKYVLLVGACILLLCLNVYSQQRVPGRIPPGDGIRLRALPENTRVIRDVEYGNAGGEKLLLDLYIPEKATGPLPLIVWIHGGGWRSGSKENCRPALLLLPFGYAVASINYRLTGIASFPAQIEDCKSAIRFLRAHSKEYNIDPERIGAWGSSAGGHLAALLGTSGGVGEFDKGDYTGFSSRVQAVCDYYGPSSFKDMSSRRFRNPGNSPEALLLGGAIGARAEMAANASPVTYVTQDDPPFFIVHGDKDNTVHVSQSEILHNALSKAGVEVEKNIIKNAGHGGPEFTEPELIKRIAEFFDKHLKK